MKNISGYVENITFRNEDNGYTVLTLLSGKKEIKCTGTFGYIGEGEYVEIEGEEVFHDIYGDNTNTFVEENGRRLFLLYLKPIINGTGNYYIEAQTRDQTRTDIIVDYLGKQYVIELKIWHGNEYNKRGEEQLAEYLEYYHLDKGYLLSFNFNKNKQTGLKEIQFGDKILVEVVV